MAQQHGLGRGLSSLIPPKKEETESPFKDMVLKSMVAQGIDLSGRPVAVSRRPADSPDPVSDISAARSASDSPAGNGVLRIPVGNIVPNPHQPRVRFDEGKLRELSESIREHGVLQPIAVTPLPDGKYELIAGERRLQASKLAGIPDIPVIVRDADERQKLELAIIENVQRHDLDPVEEAKAYARLSDEFGLTQEDIAKRMGKSRSTIANMIRLLSLPVDMRRALSENRISEGHAKVLLSIENPEKRLALFERIVRTGMTVRESEVKARESTVRAHVRRVGSLPPEVIEKVDRIATALGTKVAVKPSGSGGRIVVEYYSDEEFEQIVSRMTHE